MPHFYNGDPALLEKVESGLEPDKDKHVNFIDFEIVGTFFYNLYYFFGMSYVLNLDLRYANVCREKNPIKHRFNAATTN